MSITSIISAIGNNSSVYPLILRDCGIEASSKVYLTYKENKKENKEIAKIAARERFVDEYGISAIWLGGIPLVERICDFVIKKFGYNTQVNPKLFNNKSKDALQSVDINIKKFKDLAPDAVADLKKLKDKKGLYEGIISAKFAAATIVPIILMGVLTRLNYNYSKKKMAELKTRLEKENSDKPINTNTSIVSKKLQAFKAVTINPQKNIAFKGRLGEVLSTLTDTQKMASVDGGLTIVRLKESRNKNEFWETVFKMSGMCLLNYVVPGYIAKIFDFLTGKALNLNVNLDPIMINDDEFISQIKNNRLLLPKSNSEKDILEFIDNNPDSLFVKFGAKLKKITMYNNKVRDPRAYVNIKKLVEFKTDIENFAKNGLSSKSLVNHAKKAKIMKSVNILSNVAVSSILLAWALPKAQYAFRNWLTGSNLEPGLINSSVENK